VTTTIRSTVQLWYSRFWTSFHVGNCRPSISVLRDATRLLCSSLLLQITSIFTKGTPASLATHSHSRRVSSIGLHESETTVCPRRRLSPAILYASRYPSPSTWKEQRSRSPCSIVSIRRYVAFSSRAISFANVDFP